VLYYRAVNAQGETVTGSHPASAGGEREVIVYLQSQGLTPLRVQAAPFSAERKPVARRRTASARKPGKWDITLFSSLSPRDLITFAQDVAVLLESGISLARGLSILQDLNVHRRSLHALLVRVHEDLREGSSFWEALDRQQPKVPPVFVSMVRAGETGGALPLILNRLADYLEDMQELKEFLRGAMIYPAILTLTSLMSMVVMLIVVVPKFAQVFTDMGMELPTMTQWMFAAGEFMQERWWVLLLTLGGGVAALALVLRTQQGRQVWDRLILRVPGIGVFKRKIEIARFCRTLGTLLDSGVPILQSMQIVRGVVMNSVLRQAIDQAHDDLKQGMVLSAALEKTGLFPALAVNMVGVGEETGRLGVMLDKVGQLYDKELKKGIRVFSSFFEPMVLLVMGTLIGGMVISMLMAIFSVNDMQM
jgi:general secretion pathway protein F